MEKFDVIVSDYQMPDKDGLEFLRELREKDNRTPFIIFTGKGREEVVIKALNLGAVQYLNKIGDPEMVYCELAHAICEVVERKRAEEALNRTQELLCSIVNSPNDMIWSVSADDFRLLTFNKGMTDYFLRTQGLVLKAGLNAKEIMPTEQLSQKWLELDRRALR
jgi:CheY-like chemotaxis protein